MLAAVLKAAKKYGVCVENGKYPAAMMVKELCPHVLDGHKWIYHDSPVMAISEEEAERYACHAGTDGKKVSSKPG